MKHFIAVTCLAVAAGFLCSQEPETGPTKHVIAELKTEILFPGKPKIKDLSDGKHVWLYPVDPGVVFSLSYSKWDEQIDITVPKNAKLLLDGGRTGGLNNLKGSKLLSEKDYVFQEKYPARIVDMDAPLYKALYRSHIIISSKAIYVITVGGPKEALDSKKATAFFDSFKIND